MIKYKVVKDEANIKFINLSTSIRCNTTIKLVLLSFFTKMLFISQLLYTNKVIHYTKLITYAFRLIKNTSDLKNKVDNYQNYNLNHF